LQLNFKSIAVSSARRVRLCSGGTSTAAAKIAAVQREGIEVFGCGFAFGDINHAKVMRSMELFAREVMPRFDTAPK
jgi:hypothetical protein